MEGTKFQGKVNHVKDIDSVQTASCVQETQASKEAPKLLTYQRRRFKASKEPKKMITYERRRFKGSKGQGSVQQVADLPGENSKTESAQPGVRGVVIALAANQVSSGPQPKRSKGRVDPKKASSSGPVAASQVGSGPQPKRSKGRVDPVKASSSGPVTVSQVSSNPQSKRSKGRVDSKKASSFAPEQSRHPQERKNRKRVAADSSDSEKTTSVSRAHRRARRRVRNGRQEGKLNDKVLSKYLGNLWQTIPNEKKASCAYIDCLWYEMYHKGDREKALKWTRREKFFSKKYVFLPICEYNHWSLVIFCHLGEDLQSKSATPCMLLLDSLRIANAKENLDKDIRKFLSGIYEDEGILESTQQIEKIPLMAPKVPQQTGDKECGYYVLYYITLFLRRAPETFSISDGYPYFMVENWFKAEEVDTFSKTLPSPDPETGLGNDLSDGGSDDVVFIE